MIMRKLTVFNFITLNGFYKGEDNDTSWHRHGEEEGRYSVEAMKGESILLFGRTTYEMMASWWPTPMAAEAYPEVARGMNSAEKIVFSNLIEDPKWSNTKVMSGDIAEKLRAMKQQPGKDLTILGSGTIVSLFADAGLIDEYQIMLDPVVLSTGTSIFNGIRNGFRLELTDTKIFKSGTIVLTYRHGKE